MKRKEVIRRLEKLGFTIVHGSNHLKAYKDGRYYTTISHENEIDERIIRKIEKQIGMKLR